MVCGTLGSLIMRDFPIKTDIVSTPWFIYALFLSLCFITFFNVNAYTIQKVGMVITSIFQKLSLIFPVILGILVYQESTSNQKYAGILLTILAIILINIKPKSDGDASWKKYWFWPFLVFFGSGLIEVTLFYVEQSGKLQSAGIDFVTLLFCMAGFWGLLFLMIRGQLSFKKQDVIAGILLGIPNFFTIYLLIKGLELGWEGSVLFPLNNLGVIVLTTIIGVSFFKEKMSPINYLGIIFSLIAVWLISS